jgi:7,8-dihydropterin-6-yl-methyl-4-(beta-D-ribofuranosyl)aminobenzene 5'-phosphate synthase
LKITTLIENSLGENQDLYNEHGLSFYIETSDKNILFDTGKSGKFIDNAKSLNVDLTKTDYLLLSHGHYDHCGGVRRLLNDFDIHPKFFISEYFFKCADKYRHLFLDNKDSYKYIGIDFDKTYIKDAKLDIHYIDTDTIKLCDCVYVFTNFERTCSFEKLNPNMKMKIDETYVMDQFKDEIALGIDTEKGLLILVGCSHPGILNIIESIRKRTDKKIYGVLGGTHLVEADKDRINKTIQYFKDNNIDLIGVSHCTGEEAIKMFQSQVDNFFINSTGTQLIL